MDESPRPTDARPRRGSRGRHGLPGTGAPELVAQSAGALEAWLRGLERVAAREGGKRPDGAGKDDGEPLFRSLVTVVLRLTFLAQAEGRRLLGGEPSNGPAAPSLADLLALLEEHERGAPETLTNDCRAWTALDARFRSLSRVIGPSGEVPSPLGRPAPRVDDAAVLEALRLVLVVDGRRVDYAAVEEEHLGRVYETLLGLSVVRQRGGLALRPARGRRHSGSHFTPRALTEPVVQRTLEPLLACMGTTPPSEQLLGLRICDPAMGGGAFLIQTCRAMGDAVVAAWRREGKAAVVPGGEEALVRRARCEVAERCLYGVDKDELAVEVSRLSLWLLAGPSGSTVRSQVRGLRYGDSLVGLSLDQIQRFHWQCAGRGPVLPERLAACGAARGSHERAKLVGDVLMGAWLGADQPKARERARRARLGLVERWLAGERGVEEELRALQAAVRADWPVFHWPLEFPEIFCTERPDPLGEPGATVAGMDAFVGNPPFLGGKRISTEHGGALADWLRVLHGSSKNTDLAAHFFRRADQLLGPRGAIGFIATNTLAQGDTRRDGLRHLIAKGGHRIYDAVRSMPWPGDAAVHIAVVHMAKGSPAHRRDLGPRLDGRPVIAIDSMLRAAEEQSEARVLAESCAVCFIGCFLRARGFVLLPDEARALGATDAPGPGEPLRPFLGGEEVNRSPTHQFCRYVIDFGDWPLERAAEFPALLRIVEERVRPVRASLGDRPIDRGHRLRWWQFANPRPELRAALAPLRRCLVAARVTKHLCFSFQPTCRTFSDQLCVFALDDYSHFAILQARVHALWARLHSSTFGEGLRYAPSDCVETFPFPIRDPRSVIPALREVGETLYRRRAEHMVASGEGLTATYNRLLDPDCHTAPVVELRRLHEALDRAVLGAYGWEDLVVPPFCPVTPSELAAGESFRSALLDRLTRLNAERAADQDR